MITLTRKMKKKPHKKTIRLEERLMDLIEVRSMYEDLPSIYFDIQINEILIELENIRDI